jgi:hypothetical protein
VDVLTGFVLRVMKVRGHHGQFLRILLTTEFVIVLLRKSRLLL